MAGGRRDLVLERRWRGWVERWGASGLSVREFCRRHGLSEASFHFWKRELPAREAAAAADAMSVPQSPPASSPAKTQSPPAPSPPLFVPVTVLPESKPSAAGPALTLAVEVRCPSGHVVVLPSCEVSTLASLFAALAPRGREEPSC